MGLGFLKAAVLGGAQLGANLYQGEKGRESTEGINEQQIKLADRQMAFQERMRNTAYVSATNDMRNAGLNPMLAFSQGGAQSPQGAQAQLQVPRYDEDLKTGVSSAIEARRVSKEIKAVDSQTRLNAASEAAQKQNATLQQNTAKVKKEELKQMKMRTPTIKRQEELNQESQWYDHYQQRVQKGLGTAQSAAQLFKTGKEIISPWRQKSDSSDGRGRTKLSPYEKARNKTKQNRSKQRRKGKF